MRMLIQPALLARNGLAPCPLDDGFELVCISLNMVWDMPPTIQ